MKHFLAFITIWFFSIVGVYWVTASYFTVIEGWNWRALFMGFIVGPFVTLVSSYLYLVTKNKAEYVQTPPLQPTVVYNYPNPNLPEITPYKEPEKEGGETA